MSHILQVNNLGRSSRAERGLLGSRGVRRGEEGADASVEEEEEEERGHCEDRYVECENIQF